MRNWLHIWVATMAILLTGMLAEAHSQSAFSRIYLEGVIESNLNQSLPARIAIYTPSDPNWYVETTSLAVDTLGKWWLEVGGGTVDGSSTLSSFFDLDFARDSIGLRMEVDVGTGYQTLSNSYFEWLPYAYHASSSGDTLYFQQLTDVDTSGLAIGQFVYFDGGNWSMRTAMMYSDSALFAF